MTTSLGSLVDRSREHLAWTRGRHTVVRARSLLHTGVYGRGHLEELRMASHADRVYSALKRDILGGALAPGAALREEELGRFHHVSRTPVREALGRLESEGLAARHPRSGMVVSTPTLDEIVDLYVVREALEGMAARLATERRTEADLARLEILVQAAEAEARAHVAGHAPSEARALAGMQTPSEARAHAESHPQANSSAVPARLFTLGDDFHFLIWRMTGNVPLQRALNDVHDVVQRFQPKMLGDPGLAERSLREHRELLEAIRARDAVAAERLAVEHVRLIRNARIAQSVRGVAAAADLRTEDVAAADGRANGLPPTPDDVRANATSAIPDDNHRTPSFNKRPRTTP
jgi:DNA-binding GntR family transcriptional regulator